MAFFLFLVVIFAMLGIEALAGRVSRRRAVGRKGR